MVHPHFKRPTMSLLAEQDRKNATRLALHGCAAELHHLLPSVPLPATHAQKLVAHLEATFANPSDTPKESLIDSVIVLVRHTPGVVVSHPGVFTHWSEMIDRHPSIPSVLLNAIPQTVQHTSMHAEMLDHMARAQWNPEYPLAGRDLMHVCSPSRPDMFALMPFRPPFVNTDPRRLGALVLLAITSAPPIARMMDERVPGCVDTAMNGILGEIGATPTHNNKIMTQPLLAKGVGLVDLLSAPTLDLLIDQAKALGLELSPEFSAQRLRLAVGAAVGDPSESPDRSLKM